jgi:large subunit ribosomal protein L32e
MEKKNKPKFNVLNDGHRTKVKSRWRKPRGTHNKKRMGMEWTGASPAIGYKNPAAIRGLHPNGTREVLVNNVSELEGLDGVSVRIAAAVGAKKKQEIEAKAKTMKLKVLNPKEKKPFVVKNAKKSSKKVGESS